MPTESSDVYRNMQKIIRGYFLGFPMSYASSLDIVYHQQYRRRLDYASLDVDNIGQLLDKMRDKNLVLYCEVPKKKATYVMCSDVVKRRQERLKRIVEEVLDDHQGSLLTTYFDGLCEKKLKTKLYYHCFGLKDLASLCKVFKLVLEGKKVKTAGKINNSRKRKR